MYCKTVEYKDYLGNDRKDECWFNLSESELTEMQWSVVGGFANFITRIANAQSEPELMKLFKDLILMSYGERTADGRGFMKKDPVTGRPLSEMFEQTIAYNKIFMELFQSTEAATEFVNNIIPEGMAEELQKTQEESK